MTTTIELQCGPLRLALRPDLGGSVAGLWRDGEPVMRSMEPQALQASGDSACFPLAPYSNRLGYRHFHWQGRRHELAANMPGMPHALHGLAWQRAWQVAAQDASSVELALSHAPDADWPFAFALRQRFVLSADALRVEMSLRNEAPHPAPAGLGWHPYFPRRRRSRLHAEIRERWEADAAMLPTRRVAQPGVDADIGHLAFDNCFDGWSGDARIRDERFALRLSSSLDRLVIYTPPQDPFFAVEPVSHVNNAMNMAEPARHGWRTLAPGESLEAWMQLQVAPA